MKSPRSCVPCSAGTRSKSGHKAVAFDVFEDRFDSEVTRILTMQVATALLVGLATPLLVASIATDRAARNPIRLVRSVLNLRRSPFARRSIARNLLQYSRPGLHPDERDTTTLLERWRTGLFGDDGSLTAYLSQAANSPVRPAH